MTLNDIFDQLMTIYGKPTPDAMRQNNLNFLSPYNPKDPPEILFKRCSDCQEIAIIAKVPYTQEQLLMNAIDLLQQCGLYTRDLDDWDRRPEATKTWLHIRPFIQEAYQRRLHSGAITTGMSGYSTPNRFAGLSMNMDEDSDDDTAETLADTVNTQLANLSAQTNATLDANATHFNTSLSQLQQQQNMIMQQLAMLTINPTAPQQQRQTFRNPLANPSFNQQHIQQPVIGPPIQQYHTRGRRGGGRYRGGHTGRDRYNNYGVTPGTYSGPNKVPIPYLGSQQMNSSTPHPAHNGRNPGFSNITKRFANQNVCFSCGFDVEDWHRSNTCQNKRPGHQDGFTRLNYLDYERAHHQFCRKGMHKTQYPL
jgi:hypothetical protein